MNKNNLKFFAGWLLGLLAFGTVAYAAPSIKDILAQLGLLQKQVDALSQTKLKGVSAFSNCFLNTAASSTPQITLGPVIGATTTTSVCDTFGRGQKLGLLLQLGATTTSLFTWEYEWSFNNVDFFVENVSVLPATANPGLRQHNTATTTHQLTAQGATTTVALKIDDVLGRYLRIRFASGTLNNNIWGVITRQEEQN